MLASAAAVVEVSVAKKSSESGMETVAIPAGGGGATIDAEEEGSVATTAGRGVKRRQYKKDTIYLYDLYTLTYDNNEQVESIEMFSSIENENVRTR